MNNFKEFGNILSERYSQAVNAADSQRAKERPVFEGLDSYVQSEFDQETNGPVPPVEPSTNEGTAEFQTESIPPEDQDTEDMKNLLLERSKKRFQMGDID